MGVLSGADTNPWLSVTHTVLCSSNKEQNGLLVYWVPWVLMAAVADSQQDTIVTAWLDFSYQSLFRDSKF